MPHWGTATLGNVNIILLSQGVKREVLHGLSCLVKVFHFNIFPVNNKPPAVYNISLGQETCHTSEHLTLTFESLKVQEVTCSKGLGFK